MQEIRRCEDIFHWLRKAIGRKQWYIGILFFLQTLFGMGSVILVVMLKEVIDKAVQGDSEGFWRAVASLISLNILQLILSAVIRIFREWACASIENELKDRLFGCLLHKDYSSVSGVHTGEWMNRLTSDTAETANGLVHIIPGLAEAGVKMGAVVIALVLMDPKLLYLIFPGGFLLVFITCFTRKISKELYQSIRQTDGALRIFLQEHLESLMIIKTFTKEEKTRQKAREKMDMHQKARMRRSRFCNLSSVGSGIVTDGMYLLGVIHCSCGILAGTLSYGTMVAIMQLIGQVQRPITNATGYLPQYHAMVTSAMRIREPEFLADDRDREEISKEQIERFYESGFRTLGLRNAAFTYESLVKEKKSNIPMVFKNLNLEIHKGDYVAFSGTSGCGKSTILKILMCLYHLDEGERYLVSAGGEENLTADWRGLFAYVPQGNQLISGSIREILAFGDSAQMKAKEKMKEALYLACADEFVEQLEYELDTCLGERGAGLSEGQMQRIAIARAIFSDHPILMLDEATSSLDEETEKKLLTRLRAMTDKTVLIVTHRPAVLSICNRQIVVSENGTCLI